MASCVRFPLKWNRLSRRNCVIWAWLRNSVRSVLRSLDIVVFMQTHIHIFTGRINIGAVKCKFITALTGIERGTSRSVAPLNVLSYKACEKWIINIFVLTYLMTVAYVGRSPVPGTGHTHPLTHTHRFIVDSLKCRYANRIPITPHTARNVRTK